MNQSILMYCLKLTFSTKLKNQKIKTLNVSSAIENSPKMNGEKFGLSVSAVFCAVTWILDFTGAENAENIYDFYRFEAEMVLKKF